METSVLRKGKAKSDSEILTHEFLTIPEETHLLRVTQRTVYNLIYGGSLQAVRITGKITIIQKTDFMNMLKINEFNSSREQQSQVSSLSSHSFVASQTIQAKEKKPGKIKKESSKEQDESHASLSQEELELYGERGTIEK